MVILNGTVCFFTGTFNSTILQLFSLVFIKIHLLSVVFCAILLGMSTNAEIGIRIFENYFTHF